MLKHSGENYATVSQNALELARSKLESDIIDFYAAGQPHKLILTSDSLVAVTNQKETFNGNT